MLLALLFLLYFFLYKNARLIRAFPTGKRRVLTRKHLRFEKGEVVFKIEPSLKPYREDSTHLIALSRSLASKSGQLTVLWGDQLIMRGPLQRETEVTAELIRVFEDELEPLVSEGVDAVGSSLAPEVKSGSVVLEKTGMTSEKGRRKRVLRVAAAAVVVTLFGSGIAFFAIANSISVPSEPQPAGSQTGSQKADESKDSVAGDADDTADKKDAGDTAKEDVDVGMADGLHDEAEAQGVASGSSGGSGTGSTGGSSGGTGSVPGGSTGTPVQVWHEGWNEWVVDVPGHYEQRLVRGAWDEQTGHVGSVCWTCGADISGFAGEHILQTGHAGYYTAWIEGSAIHHDAEYENVWVPEQGHNVWHEGYWD
jgi:hypothetical protein